MFGSSRVIEQTTTIVCSSCVIVSIERQSGTSFSWSPSKRVCASSGSSPSPTGSVSTAVIARSYNRSVAERSDDEDPA